jgi:hypothetical protein
LPIHDCQRRGCGRLDIVLWAWSILFGKGVEEFAQPFAIALAVLGAIVVVSMVIYWRRKEQELAAAAKRDIPGVAGGTVPRSR